MKTNGQQVGDSPTGGIVEGGLVDVGYAMDFLSQCRASIYKLMDAGELAYAKIGRSRRIPLKALHQFAARALVGAK